MPANDGTYDPNVMYRPPAFDWRSLITPAMGLGFKALGDKVAPGADLQAVKNQQQQNQFNNQLKMQQLGQSNQIRQTMMPGMYTALGFSPEQGQRMASDYAKVTPASLGAPGGTYGGTYGGALQQKAPGLGSAVGKAALGVGLGLAPGLVSGATAGLGAGTMTGMAGALGATGMATLGIGAAAALGAIMWKKSQVHPTADKWVQTAQNPFDQSMAALDKSGQPPDQIKAAKQENARNYLTTLQQFAQQGGHEAIVAKQAADTFRQWYGDPAQYGVQLGF